VSCSNDRATIGSYTLLLLQSRSWTTLLVQRNKAKKVKAKIAILLTWVRDQKCFTISQVAADCHELMIYRSALCGHPLPASANNWTRGLQVADIPPPQSATLGLHPVARKLLLISRPAEGRRLSWPDNATRTRNCYLSIRMLIAVREHQQQLRLGKRRVNRRQRHSMKRKIPRRKLHTSNDSVSRA